MTPEQKAEEIFGKFYQLPMTHAMAKDSALIAVEEIIKLYSYLSDEFEFLQKVKNYIEKL